MKTVIFYIVQQCWPVLRPDANHLTNMAQNEEFPVFSEEKSIYFNAVGLAVTAGDIVLTLVRNNVPVVTLNTSYPVAKSLAEGLTKMLADVEAASGQKIIGMQELLQKFAANPHGFKPPQ